MDVEKEIYVITIDQPGFPVEELVAKGTRQKERLMLGCLRLNLKEGSTVRYNLPEVRGQDDSQL